MSIPHIADWFFFLFHAGWVIFNLTGWKWKRTRKANLITLLLTGLSWTVLGIWYGFGYCPITHWHWEILHKLGVEGLPHSYMKYLIDRCTGLDLDSQLVDYVTGGTFIAALAISIALNFLDTRKNRTYLKYP